MKTTLYLILGVIIGTLMARVSPHTKLRVAVHKPGPNFLHNFQKNSDFCVDAAGEIDDITVVNTKANQSEQHPLAAGDGLTVRRPLPLAEVFTPPATPFIERLLDAIEQVESGGRADAVGDGGRAVGAYQLWPLFVDDANRIAGTRYTYDDRWCPVKSREMTRIVIQHYSKGMPQDKWAIIHISPSKRMDWDRPAAKEYLRKINEVIK